MRGFFLRCLGYLPLRTNHALGGLLGRLAWYFSPRHRRTLRANLEQFWQWRDGGGNDWNRALLKQVIAAQGEGITELAYVWSRPLKVVCALVQSVDGWDAVDRAQGKARPIIFVAPHLGCYEMAGRYVASKLPFTALYRPPKLGWVEPLMKRGRDRGGATTVPANAAGVRELLKTLKRGGNIFLLPDQVPAAEQGGDGVWAEFLGRPAYTMTLLPRLARDYAAEVIFVFAQRLPNGRGYALTLRSLSRPYSDDKASAARQTNAMVEELIRMAPAQYLWSYNRFKRPAGAPPSAANESSPEGNL